MGSAQVSAAAQPSGDRAFTGAVPQLYDRHLGPVVFVPYAQDLAARLRCRPGARVLEIACGTGISTTQLLARLPADGKLVATDLNQAMLDHARKQVAADPRIEWREIGRAHV
jgi:predicted O-methyltransferase YrrM